MDFKKLKIPELKDCCRQRKLKVSGLIADLIQRLVNFEESRNIKYTDMLETFVSVDRKNNSPHKVNS
jgi:hypothetical protein